MKFCIFAKFLNIKVVYDIWSLLIEVFFMGFIWYLAYVEARKYRPHKIYIVIPIT